MSAAGQRSWRDGLRAYLAPASLRMLALGFSAGLPLLLVVGTLSFRLREAGIDRAAIGYLSWVALAYAFKWVWAPLVDRWRLPWLGRRLGRRRSWLLLGQAGVMAGLLGMACADPRGQLGWLVACALLVAFASATQDIALDAYRIESAPPDAQPALAACYQTGYRLAMIWAGAGALWLASLGQPAITPTAAPTVAPALAPAATQTTPASAQTTAGAPTAPNAAGTANAASTASAPVACARPADAATAAAGQANQPSQGYDQRGWARAYAAMAASMLVGLLTLLLAAPEPPASTLAVPEGRLRHMQAMRRVRRRGVPVAGLLAFALWLALLATLIASALGAGWMRASTQWLPTLLWGSAEAATPATAPANAWEKLLALAASTAPQWALLALALACTLRAARASRTAHAPCTTGTTTDTTTGESALRWRPKTRAGTAALAWVQASFVMPFADFFGRHGRQALPVLLLIGTYRISDMVMGVMANPFYVDMCFTKTQVAAITKTWGLGMTLLGAFAGGALAVRFGVVRMLMLGALLSAVSNLLFAWLAGMGHSVPALVAVVSADNLASGLASAAFVGYLSGLTNLSYSATQYALFSSLMLLGPKFLAGFSGDFVNAYGYVAFFNATALLGLPVLALVWLACRSLPPQNTAQGIQKR